MKLEDCLSEVEKSELVTFNSRPAMVEAVKKILLFGVYNNGTLKPDEPSEPQKNFALGFAVTDTNEEIGMKIRAAVEGIMVVENAFKEISKFKPIEPEVISKVNEAR